MSSLDPSGPESFAGSLNIASKGVPGTSNPCLGTLKMLLPTSKKTIENLLGNWQGSSGTHLKHHICEIILGIPRGSLRVGLSIATVHGRSVSGGDAKRLQGSACQLDGRLFQVTYSDHL